MKKFSLMICLVSVLLFGMSGCGHSEQERHWLSKQEKARLDSIDRASLKIGVMPTLDCLPVYLAYEDSLFLKQGVTVHLYRYNAQMDCDTAIARGRVEGTVTDLVRAARIEKKGVPLFYPVSTNLYWQLISNRKARVSELKQLSDKMIAITRHSATDYLADLAIDSAKPKYEVYRVQINDLNIRLSMLLNNEMDAMLLPEPYATRARMAQNVVLMDSRDKNINLGAIAFRTKLKSERRRKEQIDRFLTAYDIAVDSINKNGVRKYATLLKKYYNLDAHTIKSLPQLKYSHAMEPLQRDLQLARKRAENK